VDGGGEGGEGEGGVSRLWIGVRLGGGIVCVRCGNGLREVRWRDFCWGWGDRWMGTDGEWQKGGCYIHDG